LLIKFRYRIQPKTMDCSGKKNCVNFYFFLKSVE
jgi:hypothetical protein